jgi:hypothetical protein
MSKIFYGPDASEIYRLSPAPQINIDTQINYANDLVIGYTYVINIRGYASTYYASSSSITPSASEYSLSKVLDSVAKIKDILTRNGSNLTVVDTDNTTVLRAKGGTLRSLSFNDSTNHWAAYAEYTAEIEFNEVELISGNTLENIQCSQSFLSATAQSSSVVDISKYKIKNFSDSFSISTNEDLHSRVFAGDAGNLDTDNSVLNITYNISATGKHFFVEGNLIPAWEQAKNFAQDRLYKQIIGLLTSAIGIDTSEACLATKNLSQIGSSTNGMLSDLNSLYRVYNETISCQTSESDGTFSATYNAILKRNYTSSVHHPASIHTFNKTINTDNSNAKNVSISVEGTITGLVEGGILRTNASSFRLPANGAIILAISATNNKYSQALLGLNKIISNNDLLADMKTRLGITFDALNINPSSISCNTNNGLLPANLNLTHNYNDGTINYSIEYNTNKVCGSGSFANISISMEKPVPVLAELTIPHTGVLIQDIGTKTSGKITINIEGRRDRSCCLSSSSILDFVASSSFYVPSGVILPNLEDYVLTERQRTDNLIEGTYSIVLGYTCAQGCTII